MKNIVHKVPELKEKAYRDAYVQSQIKTALPYRIRALRKSRGWTQDEFAQRAGMAQSRVPDLERPTGKLPKLETLCRIASAYDVAVEVRFVPFSELVDDSEGFSPDEFAVPSFTEEFNSEDMPKGSR
jgi:transcriptional regulator with XRE-family HTH domain